MKALCEDEWATRTIEYCNELFGKIKVQYEEVTDFIAPDESDGVAILFCSGFFSFKLPITYVFVSCLK